MSNAMRFGKRSLAGVAAGALALGALTIASAPAASAGKTIKPKAGTIAGTVTAVRATTQGTSVLSIAPAAISWLGAASFSQTDKTAQNIKLTTAPTAAAVMTLDDTTGIDDTVSLGFQGGVSNLYVASGDDSSIAFNVDVAGTYAGQIYNGTDTVTFSFTTAGPPTSMVITPATQTVTTGSIADFTVTLKDAAGNVTQPQTVDSVTVTDNSDDTVGTPVLSGANGGALQYGTFDDTLQTLAAGTTTLTATPAGTLGATGVTAVTATVVKSGTVATAAAARMSVAVPTNANSISTTSPNFTAQVPEGTTTVTIAIDDTTTAAAGNTLRLKAVASSGTVNGTAYTTPVFVNVTTDASKRATATFALAGSAILSGQTLTVSQVLANGSPVTPAVNIVVTQLTPVVYGDMVVPSPGGSIVQKVGTATPVTVQVDDSFGTPQSGWIVKAYRTGGTFLGQGTTDATGKASVTVAPLSTTVNNGVETYYFTANPVVGSPVTTSLPNPTLSITYTTSGAVTSIQVASSGGNTISTAAPAITTITTILTPNVSTGLVVTNGGTASSAYTTVATGLPTLAGISSFATFTPTPSPANSTVVTVGDGLRVSASAPLPTTSFAGGSSSATVDSGSNVWVWATKTGTHDVTFKSGDVTITGKIVVVNTDADAYNIELTPATQDIAKGGFSTVTTRVTDAFGNTVDTDDTGAVRLSATGQVVFGGFVNTIDVSTGSAGTVATTIIASNEAGAGLITGVPKPSNTAPAWKATYVPPTGFPAPKVSVTAAVVVRDSATKSITITGSRTTVSGKPGIKIDGVVTGIDNGKTVVPYFRFPGETTFAQGSARPVISDGSFTWQRKTGKKFYAYVTSDDGVVKSNRVIIPAN